MHEAKQNRRAVPPTQRAWLASAFFLVLAPVALANPGGEEIAAGAVQIERAEALTRIQASDGAIIDWHGGFSIGAGETVEFIQPDAFSEVLNRDYSNDASRIDGSLFANGRVTIANPFGVFIGGHALVDVAHLTAAAGHVSERDFLAGNLHFGELTGVVENRGTIRADAVTLLGRRVANRGLIVSGDGTIALLAGSEIWIGEFGSPVRISLGSFAADGAAIENSGTLDAGRGSVRMAAGDVLGLAIHNTGSVAGGAISIDAGSGEVRISGSLDAADRGANGSGGSIQVGGEQIALQSAVLDVSGDTGGGSIRVGADAHGETLPGLRRARVVRVDAESSLRADAGETGDGGSIVVFADEAATVVGTLSARGGATGGDGGFIETSGINFLAVNGAWVDASAAHGAPGQWLLDPRDVDIVDGSESGGAFDGLDPNTFTPNDSGEATAAATVDAATLVSALNGGTSVTITTSLPAGLDQDGDISVLAAIHTAVPDGVTATLTLDAVGNIVFEEVVSDAAGNGALDIDLQAGGHIGFDSTINTPEGKVQLHAGVGGDSGSILNVLPTMQAKITAQSVSLEAADDIGSTAAPFSLSTTTFSATATNGSMIIDSYSADETGSVTATSLEAEVGKVDVFQSGNQDLRVESVKAGLLGVALVNNSGELTITGAVESNGGNVSLATTSDAGGSITLASTGSISTKKESVESADDIGGNLLLTSKVDIHLLGRVETGGGAVGDPSTGTPAVAVGSIEIDEAGVIDTRLEDPDNPGGAPLAAGPVFLFPGGEIAIAADIRAQTIELHSDGVEGDSDRCGGAAICFLPNATSGLTPMLQVFDALDDDTNDFGIQLQAGNPSLEDLETVDATGATFRGATPGSSPVRFAIFQNADVADAALPDASQFEGSVAGMTFAIEAVRNSDAGSSDAGIVTLQTPSKFDGSNLDVRAGETVVLDFSGANPLDVAKLDIEVGGDLSVGSELTAGITAGEWNLAADGDLDLGIAVGTASTTSVAIVAGNGGTGTLTVGNDVVLEADSVRLVGGAGGTGNLELQANVEVRADQIELVAGNGTQFLPEVILPVDAETGATLFVQNSGADRSFLIEQDAALTTADLPAAAAFSSGLDGVAYSLLSRNAGIEINPAVAGLGDVSKLAGTDLSMIAATGVEITTDSPIVVRSAEIGGTGHFTVTKELAEKIRFSSGSPASLTFRSATELATGDLGFTLPDEGLLSIHADVLTLRAGGSRSDFDIYDPPKVILPGSAEGQLEFLDKDGTAGTSPTTFVLWQDDAIVDSTLPAAGLFGNEEGPTETLEARSSKWISLGNPGSLAGAGLLLTSSPRVQFASEDENLDMDTRRVEIRTEFGSFAATGETSGGNGARVLASGWMEAGSISGWDEERSESTPDTRPTEFIVLQEGTVDDTTLPPVAAWQGGAGPADVVYTIASTGAGIDLSGQADRVVGSNLSLVVDTAGKTIDFGTGVVDVASLKAFTAGIFTITGGTGDTGSETVLRAESQVILGSGCVLGVSGACEGKGNLVLAGDLTIESAEISLRAGDPSVELPEDERPVVDVGPLVQFRLEPTEDVESTLFEVVQAGTLKSKDLPTASQFGEVVPLAWIGEYAATSTQGDAEIDAIQNMNAATLFIRADAVQIQAPELSSTELDNTTLVGNSILLEATAGSVEAEIDSLLFQVLSSSDSAGSFEIRQSENFAPAEAGSGTLPLAAQFIATQPGIKFSITSTAGDIRVDDSFSDRVAGRDLVLQSASDREVRFAAGLAAVGSLTVNDDVAKERESIVFALPASGSAQIVSSNDQVYGAPVVLEADAALAASGDIIFHETVLPDIAGSHTLALDSDGAVRFMADVGRADLRLGALDIQTPQQSFADPTLVFGSAPGETPVAVSVYTTGDINLFADGRSDVPATATIFVANADPAASPANPDLLLDSSEGSVRMGPNEKLSVPGVLVINAEDEVLLGDVSALDFTLRADTLTLIRRPGGPVLHSDGEVGTDAGVDYVANRFDFEFETLVLAGSGRDPAFGLPDPYSPPAFVITAGFPTAAINPDNTPLEASQFAASGEVNTLDLQPLGGSTADLAEVFWIPTPRPIVKAPPEVLVQNPAALIEIGIAVLPTSAAEYQSRLAGAGITDDVDSGVRLASAPVWVSEARILSHDAQLALEAYRRVLGPHRENAPQIREVLSKALQDYRSLTGARRVVGFEFRRYIKNRPNSQFEAYRALEDLDALFLHQRRSGLAPAEFEHVQHAWLEEIAPDDITPAELSQAIFPSRYVRGSEILDVYGE